MSNQRRSAFSRVALLTCGVYAGFFTFEIYATVRRALDSIVQQRLAKDPRDRYGSPAELARDLVPALARCGRRDAPQDGSAQSAADGSTLITRRDAPRWSKI